MPPTLLRTECPRRQHVVGDRVTRGRTQTVRFEAVEAGQMDLRLVYHRPWETGVEPLETFTVQVTVQ